MVIITLLLSMIYCSRYNRWAYLTILCLLLWGLSRNEVIAQDRVFSQFYAAPTLLNPALQGGFDGNFRIVGAHRDQWRNALEKPILHTAISLDLRLPLKQGLSNDFAAFGIYFVSDKAGVFELSQSTIGVGGAFHKTLDLNATQVLSAGIQLEANQRNILYEGLTFQDQFDGSTSFTNPTFEDLPENNFAFADVHGGLHYSQRLSGKNHFNIGGAFHHILQPQVSFYRNDDDEAQQALSESQLLSRYTFHAGAQIEMSDNVLISPRLLTMLQGDHAQLLIGANFAIEPPNSEVFVFHLGTFLRGVRNIDQNPILDSAGFLAGLQWDSFKVGVSYDINLGTYDSNFAGRNTLEITFSYFGNYDSGEGLCPSF